MWWQVPRERIFFYAWKNRQKLANSFWKRWSQEYVIQLTAYKKWAQILLTYTSWGPSPSERWPRSKTTLETWTDTRNIQRKRWPGPFRSCKDVTRSVPSTNHNTPNVRGCCHFKSGQTLETETFILISEEYSALKAFILAGMFWNIHEM